MFVPRKKIGIVPERKVPVTGHTTEKLPKNDNSRMEFLKQSTCAAVTHLGERPQPGIIKIIWWITLIAGIALTATSTYFSTIFNFSKSGSSQMTLQESTTSWMEHPQYHICTSNNFNSTVLMEMGFVDSDMVSYFLLMVSLLTVSPVLLKNVEHQRQLETKFNKTLAENGIKDVSEVVQRALFQCEDIIAGCIAPTIYLDSAGCCAKYFPSGSFPSMTGACVSTNKGSPIYQTIPSMSFGFVILVRDLRDANRTLNNAIVNPILANQKGVSFSLSDKWTHPTVAMFEQKYYSRIGVWNSLSLLKTTIDDEETTSSFIVNKKCASRNEPNRYLFLVPGFDNYTQANCNYATRQNRIVRAVGCHLITVPYTGDLPSCSPGQMIKIASQVFDENYQGSMFSEKSECISECWQEMFSFSASHADLSLASNFKFGNWTISTNQSNNLAAFNFYYSTFTQTLLVNHYPTLPEIIGGFGGNVGLFLGASMVTIVEIFVFFLNLCLARR